MSYKVTFKNRVIIHVDSTQGLTIKGMWMAGEDLKRFEINGNAYLVGNIISVEKSNEGGFVDPFANEDRMIEGKICYGKYSIQKEINNIAKGEAGKDWAKLVTDKKWRESTRKTLISTGATFCDYKAKKCACYEGATT